MALKKKPSPIRSLRVRAGGGFLLVLGVLFLLLAPATNPSRVIAFGTPAIQYLLTSPPMFTVMGVGDFFNVVINISLVQDLRSLEFTLAYNSNILDAVQITQGSFFPLPPRSHFEFEENSILGSVKVDLSLATSEPSKNGSGTLANIRFRLIEEPDSCLCSTLVLKQTVLLDSQSRPIAHDRTGSVVFWRSMGPDPPEAGTLDEFTQKGGMGRGAAGGTFVLHEMVYLVANTLYANDPLVNKLVAFQVVNPLNETVFVHVVFSDKNGCAITMFRIPGIGSSLGTWSAFSVVEVDEKVVWDTLTFRVTFGPTVVGGRSSAYTIEGGWADWLCAYFAFTTTLTAFSALILRKNRKQRNSAEANQSQPGFFTTVESERAH